MCNYGKISPIAFGLSLGIIWAVSVIILSLLALYFSYGLGMIEFFTSVYFGYELTLLGIAIGALWSFADGFIGGFLIAWVYNLCLRNHSH